MHHAYSKHAEVTVPSLDDWERGWKEKLKAATLPSGVAGHSTGQGMPELKVLPVDFRAQHAVSHIGNAHLPPVASAQSN